MDQDTPIISGEFLKGFLEVTRSFGFSLREIAMKAGLNPEDLEGAGKKLSLHQLSRLVNTGHKILQRDDMGLELGNRLTLTSYGMAGVVAMAQPTYGEALNSASRLCEAIFPALNMEFTETPSSVVLRISESLKMETNTHFFIELIFVNFYNIFHYLVGDQYEPVAIKFAYPEPSYGKRYRTYFRCPLKFSHSSNEFEVSKAIANKPLALANSIVSKIAEEQVLAAAPNIDITIFPKKVRLLLARNIGSFPSLERAARMLGMSGRTLRRQLFCSGTTFQAELDKVRKEFAISLLEERKKSITQIALLLGFNDSSAFSRAFKRWTGVTPSQYLKDQNLEADDYLDGSTQFATQS